MTTTPAQAELTTTPPVDRDETARREDDGQCDVSTFPAIALHATATRDQSGEVDGRPYPIRRVRRTLR